MNENFCISPWINLTLYPNGDVRPCCVAERVFGNLNQESLENVINSQEATKLRDDFLNNKRPQECNRCWKQEENNCKSLRQDLNERFSDHINNKVTKEIIDFKPAFLDIRDTNLCNFRCRICHHDLSSSWWEDTKALYPNYNGPKIISANLLFEQFITKYLDGCEEVYFAGGEPLLNDNHLKILLELDKRKMHHVRLRYNTNISMLKYKGVNYLELWKKFDDVSLGLSLDGVGPNVEYSRKGANWKVIKENIEVIEQYEIPYFFMVSISLYNIFNLESLFEFLAPLKKNVWLSLVSWPEYLDIRHLPAELKDKVKVSITQLSKEYPLYCKEFDNLSRWLSCEGVKELFLEFLEYSLKLDKLRKEDLSTVIPLYSKYLVDRYDD